MNARVRQLAAAQDDVVAGWQLLDEGWSRSMVQHRVSHHGWRVIHPGVYSLTASRLTRRQLWIAATLTTRDSALSHASAGAYWGIRQFEGNFETITRPGRGGPKQVGALLVCRSTTLKGNVMIHDGIRVTTVPRTSIDLAAHISDRATGRMFREALRLGLTTSRELSEALDRHEGRRRTRVLRDLATRYAGIPYRRTRSDAEAYALEILHDAGRAPPQVNTRTAGEEADLTWPKKRRIIEIDGPQYHRFPDEDVRKQAEWEAAGYRVERIPSDEIYARPDRLLELISGDGDGGA
jgi:very-short-patch-repair endonuclease